MTIQGTSRPTVDWFAFPLIWYIPEFVTRTEMSLTDILGAAAEKIRERSFHHEEQAKATLIVPILRGLGWDVSDPDQVVHQYPVDPRWVDYALLAPGGARVFVEAKNFGRLDHKGEKQLFDYANQRGIPILILSDGNQWDFYLSMAGGDYSERRFLSVEIRQTKQHHKYAEVLNTVLHRNQVSSGAARLRAEELLAQKRHLAQAREAIPKAWSQLIEEPDAMLVELITETAFELSHVGPDSVDIADDVTSFLRKLRTEDGSSKRPRHRRRKPAIRIQPGRNPPPLPKGKLKGFRVGDQTWTAKSAIGTLVEVVKYLDSLDPGFMDQFANETAGRTINLVAQTKFDLYTNDRRRCEISSKDLGNGWWLGSNLSVKQIRDRIEIARRVSGIGSRLVLIEK